MQSYDLFDYSLGIGLVLMLQIVELELINVLINYLEGVVSLVI